MSGLCVVRQFFIPKDEKLADEVLKRFAANGKAFTDRDGKALCLNHTQTQALADALAQKQASPDDTQPVESAGVITAFEKSSLQGAGFSEKFIDKLTENSLRRQTAFFTPSETQSGSLGPSQDKQGNTNITSACETLKGSERDAEKDQTALNALKQADVISNDIARAVLNVLQRQDAVFSRELQKDALLVLVRAEYPTDEMVTAIQAFSKKVRAADDAEFSSQILDELQSQTLNDLVAEAIWQLDEDAGQRLIGGWGGRRPSENPEKIVSFMMRRLDEDRAPSWSNLARAIMNQLAVVAMSPSTTDEKKAHIINKLLEVAQDSRASLEVRGMAVMALDSEEIPLGSAQKDQFVQNCYQLLRDMVKKEISPDQYVRVTLFDKIAQDDTVISIQDEGMIVQVVDQLLAGEDERTSSEYMQGLAPSIIRLLAKIPVLSEDAVRVLFAMTFYDAGAVMKTKLLEDSKRVSTEILHQLQTKNIIGNDYLIITLRERGETGEVK